MLKFQFEIYYWKLFAAVVFSNSFTPTNRSYPSKVVEVCAFVIALFDKQANIKPIPLGIDYLLNLWR